MHIKLLENAQNTARFNKWQQRDHSREFISSIKLLWIILGVRWKDDI